MAGLFEGVAPPDITRTTTTKAEAPQYLTDYLTNLAQVGTSQLGTATPAVKDAQGNVITPGSFSAKTGAELIADRPDYFSNLVKGTGVNQAELPNLSNLSRYETALDEALRVGQQASKPIGVSYDAQGKPIFSDTLRAFYDPYQQNVIDEMQKQSDINVQRNVLPGLKALGAATGQFGGSRIGNIGGQALADIASNLQTQQTAARSAGYKTALDAALKQQGNQAAVAGALGNIGGTESAATTSALKQLADMGALDTAYSQAEIDAPLTRAANVAQLLRGYAYPTTTTENYKGPGSIYGPSVFQQIAGLGSLVGALFPQGGGGAGTQLINRLFGSGGNNTTGSDVDPRYAPWTDYSTPPPEIKNWEAWTQHWDYGDGGGE